MSESIDYDKLSNDELRVKIAEAMGWKGFQTDDDGKLIAIPPHLLPTATCKWDVPDPLRDANDLRGVRLWAWEKHGVSLSVVLGNNHVHAQVVDYHPFGHLESHDGSRESIIRAEGRATVIAVLKFVASKESSHV